MCLEDLSRCGSVLRMKILCIMIMSLIIKKQLQHKGLFLGSEHNIDEKYDPETINTFSFRK